MSGHDTIDQRPPPALQFAECVRMAAIAVDNQD